MNLGELTSFDRIVMVHKKQQHAVKAVQGEQGLKLGRTESF